MPSTVINGTHDQHWSGPKDVGILALDIYFPSQCVNQEELEKYDKLNPPGKYTKGLGQTQMGFCDDREDICSISLTVLNRLMEKTDVGYENIGWLGVGTETKIDNSKSVKSVLMQLFEPSGNTDIEGVDSTNACYGGTAALFGAIQWIESSYWTGKYAIVVCGDIAVYKDPKARPTGGAGAVAMLVGPNAPIAFENGLRASCMKHVYDFYKPDLSSEYAIVDGSLSLQCYFSALDNCYQSYKKKANKNGCLLGNNTTIEDFDAILFHTPFCRLVQKSLARLVLSDFLDCSPVDLSMRYPGLEKFRSCKLEDTYTNKDVEKAFLDFSNEMFRAKTEPSLLVARHVGNMYTPSLYGGLVSLLATSAVKNLAGKRIALFSYGSGMAASLFSMRVSKDMSDDSALSRLVDSMSDVPLRLNSRVVATPEDYAQTMMLREKTHNVAPYTPIGNPQHLFPGTWYLESIDKEYRRQYKRVPLNCSNHHNSNGSSQTLKSVQTNGAPPFEKVIQSATNGHSSNDFLQIVGS